jgi:hypothetical protein
MSALPDEFTFDTKASCSQDTGDVPRDAETARVSGLHRIGNRKVPRIGAPRSGKRLRIGRRRSTLPRVFACAMPGGKVSALVPPPKNVEYTREFPPGLSLVTKADIAPKRTL